MNNKNLAIGIDRANPLHHTYFIFDTETGKRYGQYKTKEEAISQLKKYEFGGFILGAGVGVGGTLLYQKYRKEIPEKKIKSEFKKAAKTTKKFAVSTKDAITKKFSKPKTKTKTRRKRYEAGGEIDLDNWYKYLSLDKQEIIHGQVYPYMDYDWKRMPYSEKLKWYNELKDKKVDRKWMSSSSINDDNIINQIESELGDGGSIDWYDFDKKMALINLGQIHEYAVKLDNIVNEDTQLEEWVKMKLTRVEQNMSDVKKSLEGWEKFADGGRIFKKQLLHIAKYAKDLIGMIQGGSKLMSWQENKLAISAEYIDGIYHHLDYQMGNRASDVKMEKGGGVGNYRVKAFIFNDDNQPKKEFDFYAKNDIEAENKLNELIGKEYYQLVKVYRGDVSMTFDNGKLDWDRMKNGGGVGIRKPFVVSREGYVKVAKGDFLTIKRTNEPIVGIKLTWDELFALQRGKGTPEIEKKAKDRRIIKEGEKVKIDFMVGTSNYGFNIYASSEDGYLIQEPRTAFVENSLGRGGLSEVGTDERYANGGGIRRVDAEIKGESFDNMVDRISQEMADKYKDDKDWVDSESEFKKWLSVNYPKMSINDYNKLIKKEREKIYNKYIDDKKPNMRGYIFKNGGGVGVGSYKNHKIGDMVEVWQFGGSSKIKKIVGFEDKEHNHYILEDEKGNKSYTPKKYIANLSGEFPFMNEYAKGGGVGYSKKEILSFVKELKRVQNDILEYKKELNDGNISEWEKENIENNKLPELKVKEDYLIGQLQWGVKNYIFKYGKSLVLNDETYNFLKTEGIFSKGGGVNGVDWDDTTWSEDEAYSPYMTREQYEAEQYSDDDLRTASKTFAKSSEILVKENLNNGEICVCKLKKIIGHEPEYPIQIVGTLKLKKSFLRPYYQVT